MIRILDGCKTLKKQAVLKNVCIEVEKGSVCGIVGNNGSGKTVLFKCILGLYQFDNGTLWIDGKEHTKSDGILKNASAVIETPAFLEGHTGLQNLKYLYELDHKSDKKHLENVMKQVGLDPKLKKKVRNYSLGMKQRLSIAQVLMDNKELIILDEPMNGLDKHGVLDVRRIILELKERGKTILVASHNPLDIEMLCDKVYEMEAGEARLIFENGESTEESGISVDGSF